MAINKYVGSRYVPLYCGVHDSTKAYEPLSIVSNAERNETFTSIQSVPVGVELTNAEYWAQSGFTNAGMVIETDAAPVVSSNDSELVAERTTDGYLLTLSVANAFDCDGDVGEGLTLNTMYDAGRWQFEPSKCTGVPDEIKDLTTPAELVVTDYTVLGSDIMRQRQQIVAYDDDNAALFVRTHDGKNWSDWKMIGFNGGGGGTYVLPVATASVLGGVKIGTGINVTDDGTISVTDGGGGGTVTSEWKDVSAKFRGASTTITRALANTASKTVIVGFKLNTDVSLTANTVTDMSTYGFSTTFKKVIESQEGALNPNYVNVAAGYSDGKRMGLLTGRFLRVADALDAPNFRIFGGYALGNDFTISKNVELLVTFHVDEEI